MLILKGRCDDQYSGLVIDQHCARTVLEKVQAIVDAPAPQTVMQLQSYLGMLNFYHWFLPNISTVLAPLHILLKCEIKWQWGKEAREGICRIKEAAFLVPSTGAF